MTRQAGAPLTTGWALGIAVTIIGALIAVAWSGLGSRADAIERRVDRVEQRFQGTVDGIYQEMRELRGDIKTIIRKD